MTEHMNEDRDRREQERDLYFSRRNYIVERQKKIIDSIPNLITPIILIIIAIMILEPAKNVMSEYSLLLAAETSGMERIPELQKQIGVLEKQLAALTNQSIESRLSVIEKSIAVGDLDIDEVATLQNIKADFDILKSYMFSNPEDLIELKTLQRDYQEIAGGMENYVHKDDIKREFSFLSNMFYTVLGFLGILISLAASSWYSTTKKLSIINIDQGNDN